MKRFLPPLLACNGRQAASRLAFVAALIFCTFASAWLFSGAAKAEPQQQIAASGLDQSAVGAALIADQKRIAPGSKFHLGVELTMEPGWHTYYKESGDAGMPTKIEWVLPPGFKAGPLLWQKPSRFDETGIITYGYQDKTLIATEVTVPASLAEGTKVPFQAKVKWLGCKEVCIPGGATVSTELAAAFKSEPDNQAKFATVGFDGPITSLTDASEHAGAHKPNILNENLKIEGASEKPLGLPVYLALAFVGGFILNFMPCVLPVISIKVLSFVQQAGEDPKRVFQLGVTFTAGIIASFLALGLVVIGVQQAGQSVGWGFQFQYPGFLVAMSVVVLLLAMSLFGVFYVQVSAGQDKIDALASKEGFVGTFFKGVLATILATPCTAPFLGTALGFAFTQPWWVVLTIFFTVGAGMAFPYLLLTARPGWMKYMPRPGVWMEKFKESMGFVLVGTVIWLLWVLGKQVGVDGVMWTATFLVAVALSAWMVGRLTDLTSTTRRKTVVWALALTVTGVAFYICIASAPGVGIDAPGAVDSAPHASQTAAGASEPIAWQNFSIPVLNDALGSGKAVFLDFTAAWCLTCKVNEQTVLHSPAVAERLRSPNVVPIRADWTRQDPDITRLLRKFGRSGVPLYVIFPAGKPTEAIVLPEVITPQLVLDKLDQAGVTK